MNAWQHRCDEWLPAGRSRFFPGAADMKICVKGYSGHKADERPMGFELNEREYEVREVEDRWYSPEAIYFRVIASDGNRYVLRHDERRDEWSLEGFRSSGAEKGARGGDRT